MAHLLPTAAATLSGIVAFQGLPAPLLGWLQRAGELWHYADGETTVEEGTPADTLWGVVQGGVHNHQQGPKPGLSLLLEAGEVGGVLPYSRLTCFPARGVAVGETIIYLLHRRWFTELEQRSPELVQRLVAIMNDRARAEARFLEREDKLRALGKLAAGLSHELNNPAAAISRSSAALDASLQTVPALLRSLLGTGLPTAAVASLLALAERPVLASSQLTGLEASDREDELAEWLAAQGCPEGYALAASLLDAKLLPADLAPLAALLPTNLRPAALAWLGNCLLAKHLSHDIGEASRHISTLVDDVKTYAHMDRAPACELLLVTAGLDSTLKMLAYELRQKSVQLTRTYAPDLPLTLGQASSLNQVWTNLLDNALYALPTKGGKLHIDAQVREGHLAVSIQDNGAGMTPEVLAHLFEPFYTTKPPGEGSGQGLDIAWRIVQAHGGRIDVASGPAGTKFTTWLALAPS